MYKVLKPDGKFYFSTPIGSSRFLRRIRLGIFEPLYRIDPFAYIDDKGDFYQQMPP